MIVAVVKGHRLNELVVEIPPFPLHIYSLQDVDRFVFGIEGDDVILL